MPSSFTNKVIVITGAASGIGRATSLKLASLGAILHLSDINPAGLEETAKQLPPSTSYTTTLVNVSQTADIDKWIAAITSSPDAEHNNHIDHVFSCAGINPVPTPLTEITDAYFDTLLSTNLRGTFALVRACIPHLRPGSSIVTVSSILGTRGANLMAIYSASKWAVIGFTKSIALELGPKGIRCNAVAPGYVDTPTNVSVVEGEEAVRRMSGKVALGRFGRAEEVAGVVVWLMGAAAGYVNGSVVEINGGVE